MYRAKWACKQIQCGVKAKANQCLGGVREGFTEEVPFEEEEKHVLRGQKQTTTSQWYLPIFILFSFIHLSLWL